ncbi:hypothetical protein CRYUN_Cryun15aG0078700 [Craigia yunnanensis]
MASLLLSSFPICSFPRQAQRKNISNNGSSFHRLNVFCASQREATTKISGQDDIVRRSANYHPTIWDNDFVQSLRSDYLQGESYKERENKLIGEVRMMLSNVVNPLEKLELIDTLQRLGVSYHFEDEIKKTLKKISTDHSCAAWKKDNLYATALEFRLLRQHGYHVNQEGETILENARDLAAKHLKECLKQNSDHYLSMLADHALELPLHWRMPRLETRWFIDVWWTDLGLAERLSFARDRLMENFLWSVGMMFGPQFGKSRINQTKINALVTVVDDVYNVYGTLDELELFTDAVERWDINEIQRLPNYMKICFHALYNSINEIAFDTHKGQGIDVIPFLKKVIYVKFICWRQSGITVDISQLYKNTWIMLWISIAAPVLLCHAYLATDSITKEGLQIFEEYYPNIICSSSIIVRLADDLRTSPYELKRGDVPKSIQCHMHDSGACEEEAREHIRKLIDATWKKMNQDRIAKSPFSQIFIEIAKNLSRFAQCLYHNGDGHAIEDDETKERVLSLIVQPITAPK